MKYIIVTASKTSKKPGGETSVIRYPFIFPNMLVHSHVGKCMCLLVSLMHPDYQPVVTSAGEMNSMEFEGECHGESTSIGCKSKGPEDTHLIRMSDYGANMMEI